MYHVRFYIVEKMGFEAAPRRCGIHSKPQPLLQKTCLFYVSETLVAYVGVCLCTHTLAHIRKLLPPYMGWWPLMATLVILFPKLYFCSFERLYFPLEHSSSQFNIWLGFTLALGLKVWASLGNEGLIRMKYKMRCLHVPLFWFVSFTNGIKIIKDKNILFWRMA